MRVPNEPEAAADGAFADLLRLQAEFQNRLTEETLRYLRRLQGAAAPAAPGTVLLPGATVELQVTGAPNATVELKLEVENRQRVHCVVTPMLSPLASATGVTWFPAAEPSPAWLLLAPEDVATMVIKLPLPDGLPKGVYRGALLLQGFREGVIAVRVKVEPAAQPPAPEPSRKRAAPTKKSSAAPAQKSGKRAARRTR